MKKEKDLKERTKQFALKVIRLVGSLPRTRDADIIGRQLLKAGTSVGANYRESNRSRSRAEFRSKIGIVEQELHGRGTDRLSRARTVKNDVRNRVATQATGRAFAHHPSDGVNYVRLATTIGTDHTDEVARKRDSCGVDEGFEAGELDLA